MNNASQVYDTAVIGGGPAGLTAAIALAATGARTALLARRVPYADNRTTALLGASTDLLERLEVWSRCRDKAAALRTMRLVDDTGRLIRAPEVRFSSEEIGLEQFASFRRPFSELDEIEFYFGNIDVRHHLCRQPDPLEATRELAVRYYDAVAALEFDGARRVYELLPVENERRSLPKTGYHEGTPFFGTRQARDD